jgi:hypothetical protein
MSYYTDQGKGNDWEVAGVGSLAACYEGLQASGYLFLFRSKMANCSAKFGLIIGGFGEGGGGSLSTGSPSDLVTGQAPNIWTAVNCATYFSASDLHASVGSAVTVGAAAVLGYSLLTINAGLVPRLFSGSCIGWGTGIGVSIGMGVGVWGKLGDSDIYNMS